MKIVLVMVLSYLMGSLPVGLLVGLARGVDIRKLGSGNIGATNVLRTLGKGPATLVFIGDTLKGVLPVLAARMMFTESYGPYVVIAAGFLAVLGHTASPFLGFRGGKGVATSLGMIIGMNPLIAGIAFGFWILLVALFRYVSIASLTATFSVPIMMHFSQGLFGAAVPRQYTICALVAAHLILLKHRSNIKRLFTGTEPKFGQKVKQQGE